MNRFLRLIPLLLLPISSFADTRPNLLLITVDDMNRDSIGAYGCKIPDITPNVDKLASQGMRFDQGYVNVAICMPCRAVWMTGRYPQNSGALGFDRIKKDVPSLPEALQEGGYYTALLGKEIHIVPSRHDAFDQINKEGPLGHGRDKEAYAAAVREAIEKSGDKPFFIMANAHDPHRPFAGSGREHYKPLPKFTRQITEKETEIPGFLPDIPEIRRELSYYYTSTHRADEVTGAILDEIEKAGLTNNTLVLFMSDHGMPLPFAKTNCWRASTITPWIMRWPGKIKPGSTDSSNFVSGIDVAPTLLDAAGLPNLEGADGKSILPLLKGEKQDGRDKVFTFIEKTFAKKYFQMRAVNDGSYLYIWNGWADGETKFKNESMSGLTYKAMADSDDPKIKARADFYLMRCRHELYDMKKDPDCLTNLVDAPSSAHEATIREMAKELHEWMKGCADPDLELFEEQMKEYIE